jgi:DNA end-binding protein Ku
VLDEIVKAVQVEPNQYVQVEREEIEDIELETSHTIDIVKFVPQIEIDDLYYDKPYYIVPDGEIGQEAFAVIRAALDEKGMAGIGRVVFSRRERSIVLKPYGTTGMTGVTLWYPYELRDAAEFFNAVPEQKIEAETLQLAHQLIRAKAGQFDPAEFEDRYEKALKEIIAAKQRGATVLRPAAAKAAPQVINLMDALKKSVHEAAAGSTARRKPQITGPLDWRSLLREVEPAPQY